MQKSVLAIDIGASSGRHMLGTIENGKLKLEEIYRFPNGISSQNGRLCWDEDALWQHILEGLKTCKRRGVLPQALGIDTWAVDYALADKEGRLLHPIIAYRDERTKGVDQRLERTMSFPALYERSGIAKQPFNTLYQLMSEPPETLDKASRCLLVPDWFHYKLCGVMINEYTNSSTTGLVNASARAWDKDILKAAGIPLSLFPQEPVMPGVRLGKLLPDIAQAVGFSCDVILPATHDTASAFMAVPAKNDQSVYLSSGTWSLLGVENETPVTHAQACSSGFTNEGGYGGNIRFLRNIMGLWVLQCIRHEWHDRYSFSEMADMAARGDRYNAIVDLSDNRFLAPASMTKELKAALREHGSPCPQSEEELLACVTRSLARCYADSIHKLERLTGKRYTSLNIVGGGSQNSLLNQWTANAAGLPVYAGPSEGTALGNILAQMIHYDEISSLSEGRALLRHSFPITAYEPRKDDKR